MYSVSLYISGIAEVYRFAKRIYATLTAKHPTTRKAITCSDYTCTVFICMYNVYTCIYFIVISHIFICLCASLVNVNCTCTHTRTMSMYMSVYLSCPFFLPSLLPSTTPTHPLLACTAAEEVRRHWQDLSSLLPDRTMVSYEDHRDMINEPQLPWLQTAVHHTGLDVKNESHPMCRMRGLYLIQGSLYFFTEIGHGMESGLTTCMYLCHA